MTRGAPGSSIRAVDSAPDSGRTPRRTRARCVRCSPHGVPAGSRDGGRFAAAAHTEPDVVLQADRPAGDAATSRFATAGGERRAAAPAYRHDGAYCRERPEAFAHLNGFAERDRWWPPTTAAGHIPGVVLRPRRSDGEFGSPESLTVPVTLGVGRYTFDVTAHRLAMGELGYRVANAAERDAICVRLEQARLESVPTWPPSQTVSANSWCGRLLLIVISGC